MLQWRDYSREQALDEMLRLEGRGVFAELPCGECSAPLPLYRCTDCFGGELFCQQCILSMHRRNPFHVVEVSTFINFSHHSIKARWHLVLEQLIL
jgi:hypothetical protein